MGVKADGVLVDGTHDGDVTFFCETFAEIVNVKRKHCNNLFYKHAALWVDISYYNGKAADCENDLDEACKSLINSNSLEAEIITSDGILFFQTNPKDVFGISIKNAHALSMPEAPCDDCNSRNYLYHGNDQNGNVSTFYNIYKVFCMDIDGIDKGEDPFGYGIRVDGKIILGTRAQEWLDKNIQEK